MAPTEKKKKKRTCLVVVVVRAARAATFATILSSLRFVLLAIDHLCKRTNRICLSTMLGGHRRMRRSQSSSR
jgi:hypothetical protein